MQECYNDACYYRDQLRAQFFYGNATLRQRGLGEAYYWHILSRISRMLAEMETIPEDLSGSFPAPWWTFITAIFHCSSLFRILGPSASFSP